FSNHEEGQWGAWEPHHRVSKASGGSDCASNGEALCLDCHKKTYTYGKKL
ncbi:HNH endonuclease, partial [Acinetobacter baumannii]